MTAIDPATARSLVTAARVGRLATVTEIGTPHVVPCCFAVEGDRLYSAVDGKPKSTTALKRLANIRAQPAASLVVDHYAEDWTELWWVRVDGTATVVESSDERQLALDALAAKYEQYRAERPAGPVIRVDIAGVSGWSFSPLPSAGT